MTIILFCKIVYILSCIGMLWPAIDWHKEMGYMSLETIIWSIFCTFIPVVNSVLFVLYFVDTVPIDKVFTYKLWERK